MEIIENSLTNETIQTDFNESLKYLANFESGLIKKIKESQDYQMSNTEYMSAYEQIVKYIDANSLEANIFIPTLKRPMKKKVIDIEVVSKSNRICKCCEQYLVDWIKDQFFNYINILFEGIYKIQSSSQIQEILIKNWNIYNKFVHENNKLFYYLNLIYLKKQSTNIFQLGQEQFAKLFFSKVALVIAKCYIEENEKSQKDSKVSSVELFYNLLYDEKMQFFQIQNEFMNKINLTQQSETEEEMLLTWVGNYYQAKQELVFSKLNSSDYMKQLQQICELEKTNCIKYFNYFLENVEKVLDDQLIENFFKSMREEKYEQFLIMFQDLKYEDLKNCYALSMRISKTRKIFQELFSSIMGMIFQEFENKEVKTAKNFQDFTEQLFNFQIKYVIIYEKCFDNDSFCQQSVTKSFTKFINNSQKYLYYLILSFDQDFTSNLLNEPKRLNLYFYFFNLIIYKTEMSTMYLKMFVNRQFNYWGCSGNLSEIETLKSFQEVLNNGIYLKVQNILKDLREPKDYQGFEGYCKLKNKSFPFDYNFSIINNALWMDYTKYYTQQKLPDELKELCTTFSNYFYDTKELHLQVIASLGTSEIFLRLGEKSFLLHVTNAQLCFLYLFNHHGNVSLTFTEIYNKLQLTKWLLVQIIKSLLESKILLIVGENGEQIELVENFVNGQTIDECLKQNKFKLNDGFVSEEKIINCIQSFQQYQRNNYFTKKHYEKKTNTVDILHKLESLMIKTLKKKKSIIISDYYDLICSEMKELKINCKFFKERMENLIAREYIKRDENDKQLICYMP